VRRRFSASTESANGLPAQHGKLEGVADLIVGRQAQFLREETIDVKHHLARSLGVSVAAALVGGEDLVIAEFGRASAGDLADAVEDAGFEVDQGADDVECENLEMAERHGSFFSVALDFALDLTCDGCLRGHFRYDDGVLGVEGDGKAAA